MKIGLFHSSTGPALFIPTLLVKESGTPRFKDREAMSTPVEQIRQAFKLKQLGAIATLEFNKLRARILDDAPRPNPQPSATSESMDGTTFAKLATSFSTLIGSVANVMPDQVAGSKCSYRSVVTGESLGLTDDECIPATPTPPPMSARTPSTAKRCKQDIGATKQPTLFEAGATATITASNGLNLKVNQPLKPSNCSRLVVLASLRMEATTTRSSCKGPPMIGASLRRMQTKTR